MVSVTDREHFNLDDKVDTRTRCRGAAFVSLLRAKRGLLGDKRRNETGEGIKENEGKRGSGSSGSGRDIDMKLATFL